ncbi:adenylate cyclase [Rhizobiales bacterium GAS113]|nr:adenylate cyclase [Rhizobiales bacterium GAS113]
MLRSECVVTSSDQTHDGAARWVRPLRFHLSVIVVTLLVAIAAALIGLNFYQGRKAAIASAGQEMRIFSERIVERYRAVFGAAALTVDLASGAEIVRRPEADDQARLGRFLQRVLRSSEYVDSAYVGYPSGAFVQAISLKNNPLWARALSAPAGAAFATRIIAVDDQGPRMARWEFLAADDSWLATTDPQPTDYDPRERPWYQSAVQQPALISTAPYRMATTDVPGITLARRHSAYGTIVIGVDVLLGAIDAFLATQLITPSSRVLIFDAADRLIARSDQSSAAEPRCTPNCGPSQGEPGLLVERARSVVAGMERGDGGTWTIPVNGHDYLLVVSSISSTPLLAGGHIAALAPVADLTQASERLLNEGLILSACVLALGIICAFLAANGMSRSLRALTAQAQGLTRLEFGAPAKVRSRILEISQLAAAMRAARSTISAFGLYVPKELVRRIIGSREFTGRSGERQNVTALFSDIRDFTTICEQRSAEDVVSMLSDYFDLFSEAVQRHRGVIIQFSGDAVFALWNAPQADDLHIDRACLCAFELRSLIAEFNGRQRQSGAPELYTRFGIHTGPVVVGSVGAKDRFQYTAMGDAVNVAARLEGLNKEFGTTILVSAAVAAGARTSFRFRKLGPAHVKGREEPVEVLELCASAQDVGTSVSQS